MSLSSFQYSAFITVILAGQVALCAVAAVYKYEVSEMFTIWVTPSPSTPTTTCVLA